MRTLVTILVIFTVAALLYCSGEPGQGGNHPTHPPGSMMRDTVKSDSVRVDSVKK